ncbi:E3 ubiquitin-protein ligase MBR2-like [Rutidosis leptorrhynchoides]|uniref:E3 ubiquitin-protein ligase MBR2-like n=1 Tax=Rutidosis leptorrhynchoides TaxID=125765 RepID=UPI003A993F0B
MQGQKGNFGSLPETLTLEGSTSSDSSILDQQIHWTNFMQHPSVNTTIQGTQNLNMWSIGESSSSSIPTQPITEPAWSSLTIPFPEPLGHEQIPSTVSLGDVHTNTTHMNMTHMSMTHNPSTSIGIKPSNYVSGSSSGPFAPGNRQLPRKRKATELSIGQSSSGIETSNIFQRPENSNSMSYDPIIPRLGLGVGGVSSENRAETTRRNVRIRINNPRQQELLTNSGINNGQINFSSSQPSLGLNPVVMRSPPILDNSSSQTGQPVLRVPTTRRNSQPSSRSRSSSSRASRSSNIVNGSLDNSRTIPINISDHPIFVQQPSQPILRVPALNNNGVAATSSNVGPNRGSTHYPSRRLSEILRRSLLPSSDNRTSVVGGGQNGNLFSSLPPPVRASREARNVPNVFGLQRHHLVNPFLARAAGSEGRARLASEIRNVLDLLRRGEGLRFEDVMLLDQSVMYGLVDIQDRHRDMRLDIDNMSYEELLALEERIGNVNVGLTEENISSCLKQKAYADVPGQQDTEPCCICQEEYKKGDDVGSLKCGHDFHTNCIKQWLLQKNSCPVCKSAASATNK